MDMENIKNFSCIENDINELWRIKKDAEKRLERINKSLLSQALIRCNKVACVGAYTVGADEKGYCKLEITDDPVTFSDKGIEEVKKIGFSSNGKPVEVKVMTLVEFLKQKKSDLEFVLDNVNKLLESC